MDILYVVMPAYNEEDNIEEVVSSWYPVLEGKDPLSRLVVADGFENRGIGRLMILAIMDRLKRMGFKSCRYLVADNNVPALRSYQKLEFSKVGETDLFGCHFLCFEKGL